MNYYGRMLERDEYDRFIRFLYEWMDTHQGVPLKIDGVVFLPPPMWTICSARPPANGGVIEYEPEEETPFQRWMRVAHLKAFALALDGVVPTGLSRMGEVKPKRRPKPPPQGRQGNLL